MSCLSVNSLTLDITSHMSGVNSPVLSNLSPVWSELFSCLERTHLFGVNFSPIWSKFFNCLEWTHLSGVNFHAARSFWACSNLLQQEAISCFISRNMTLIAGSRSIVWSCAELGFWACLSSCIWVYNITLRCYPTTFDFQHLFLQHYINLLNSRSILGPSAAAIR